MKLITKPDIFNIKLNQAIIWTNDDLSSMMGLPEQIKIQ